MGRAGEGLVARLQDEGSMKSRITIAALLATTLLAGTAVVLPDTGCRPVDFASLRQPIGSPDHRAQRGRGDIRRRIPLRPQRCGRAEARNCARRPYRGFFAAAMPGGLSGQTRCLYSGQCGWPSRVIELGRKMAQDWWSQSDCSPTPSHRLPLPNPFDPNRLTRRSVSLEGTSRYGGRAVWVVRGAGPSGKVRLWIDKSNYRLLRATTLYWAKDMPIPYASAYPTGVSGRRAATVTLSGYGKPASRIQLPRACR